MARLESGAHVDAVMLKRLFLERFQLTNRRAFSGRTVALNGKRLEFVDVLCREAGDMELQLNAYVWAQKLQDEQVALSVSYPSTWWQAFKQRWFPARVLRRWPVRKTTVSKSHRFRTLALFPGYSYEAPERLGEHLLITTVDPAGAP